MQSASRIVRSPVSEPPESTSDESFQDSDAEEVIHMSPMMTQFQIPPSLNVDHAQALHPSAMTFQFSESVLQPVDDPDNGQTLRNSPDTSVVGDDESELAYSPPPLILRSSSISFGSARMQGSGTRLQHDSEGTNQLRMSVPTSSNTAFPSSHSPTDARAGDQRPPGIKQQKKSKMHQCKLCKKMFPRPSGLTTHMNSHSGAKRMSFLCITTSSQLSGLADSLQMRCGEL